MTQAPHDGAQQGQGSEIQDSSGPLHNHNGWLQHFSKMRTNPPLATWSLRQVSLHALLRFKRSAQQARSSSSILSDSTCAFECSCRQAALSSF